MNWRETPLSQVLADARNGTWGSPAKGDGSDLPVLRSTNIHNTNLVLDDVAHRSVSERSAERYQLLDGDIIVATSSGSKRLIGKNTLFQQPEDNQRYLFSNFTLRLRPRQYVLIPRYLHLFLNSSRAKAELLRIQSTTSGLRNLNISLYLAQSVPVPPLLEQRRIVEILDQADALRKKRADADAKADRILPALFYKMFGDPTTNAKGLDKKRLGDLIKVRSGNFLPAKNMDPEGQYPVYGGNGINGYHSEYMFEQPVIVLGRVGAYCGAIYYSEPNCWVTDNALYVAEQSDDLHPYYLTEALRVANLNQYAGRAGQPLISGNRIYPVEILVPPPEDQETFARSIMNLHRDEKRRKDADDHIQKLFSVLLHRAFTGYLTATWRETHMKELLTEMEAQTKILALTK